MSSQQRQAPRREAQSTIDATRPPRISVIVPVRNGRADLEKLIAALSKQTFPRSEFEVVIADDGSTDGTAEWLCRINSDLIRVTIGPPRNSYAARNRAVEASRGSILAFCDADCIPEPTWLVEGAAALEACDVVAGRFRFVLPAQRTVWTLLDMDTSKDHEREVRNGTAETANLFLRRELFDRLSGFEAEIPEFGDFDFAQRAVALGASLNYVPEATVWHPTRNRAKQFVRAHWIYSRGYAAREGRAGRIPSGLRMRALVPIVPQMRSRRWWGRSYGPDRSWLGENGIAPTTTEVILALPIMYLVMPYLSALAQLLGWFDGRSLRREKPVAQEPDGSSSETGSSQLTRHQG